MINKPANDTDIMNYNQVNKLSVRRKGNKITLKNKTGGEWYFTHDKEEEIWADIPLSIAGVNNIVVYVHSWMDEENHGGLSIYPMVGSGSKYSPNGLVASLTFEV